MQFRPCRGASAQGHKERNGKLAARTLHCYVEGTEGDWEGSCPDLEIAVRGRSFAEVVRDLREAVALHLETIWGLPPEQRRSLVEQPTPWAIRLELARHWLRGLISGPSRARQRHRFTLPVAA
jgi:predicted RNase H-like HicB family nuclease